MLPRTVIKNLLQSVFGNSVFLSYIFLLAFMENNAASPPLILHNAVCEIATDYTKKKNVLRVKLSDGSEYLFMASSQNSMVEWLSKIQFYAGKYLHETKSS